MRYSAAALLALLAVPASAARSSQYAASPAISNDWTAPQSFPAVSVPGPGGTIVAGSSITAGSFWGDGSHLLGINYTIITTTATPLSPSNSYSTSQTTFGQCVTGTTVSWTAQGNGWTVFTLSGAGYMNCTDQDLTSTVLIDGVSPFGSSAGIGKAYPFSSGVFITPNFTYAIFGIAAGVHSACVSVRVGGTGCLVNYPGNNAGSWMVQEFAP